jgi:hypothetical protein
MGRFLKSVVQIPNILSITDHLNKSGSTSSSLQKDKIQSSTQNIAVQNMDFTVDLAIWILSSPWPSNLMATTKSLQNERCSHPYPFISRKVDPKTRTLQWQCCVKNLSFLMLWSWLKEYLTELSVKKVNHLKFQVNCFKFQKADILTLSKVTYIRS